MPISLEKTNCPRCNSEESSVMMNAKDYLYNIPGEFYISRCVKCGFWFQNPHPPITQVSELYPKDYIPYSTAVSQKESLISQRYIDYLKQDKGYKHLTDSENGFNWTSLFTKLKAYNKWRAGVDLIPSFSQNGLLLEIGSANGRKLASLQRLGWKNLHGIELSAAAVQETKAAGFNVECGLVEDILSGHPDGMFDVILTSMVIEHLTNPFKIVAQIATKLKPGGQFLFSTEIMDSIEYKLYREFATCFDLPRHFVYFQKKDIYKMLEDSFENIEIFHQSYPVDFMRSSQWRSDNGKAKIYDPLILKLKGTRLAELATLILAWTGSTTRISVHCRKKK